MSGARMAEPSRVIHIRNVGHEISEVSESWPPFPSCSAEFLARIALLSGSKFDLFGLLVACRLTCSRWCSRLARSPSSSCCGPRTRCPLGLSRSFIRWMDARFLQFCVIVMWRLCRCYCRPLSRWRTCLLQLAPSNTTLRFNLA